MHKFSKKQRGVILIELALAIPVLVTFLFAFYDFIVIFRTKSAMDNITRIGTLWLNSRIPHTDNNGVTALTNVNTAKAAATAKINNLITDYGLAAQNVAVNLENNNGQNWGTVTITATLTGNNLIMASLFATNGLTLTSSGTAYRSSCCNNAKDCFDDEDECAQNVLGCQPPNGPCIKKQDRPCQNNTIECTLGRDWKQNIDYLGRSEP